MTDETTQATRRAPEDAPVNRVPRTILTLAVLASVVTAGCLLTLAVFAGLMSGGGLFRLPPTPTLEGVPAAPEAARQPEPAPPGEIVSPVVVVIAPLEGASVPPAGFTIGGLVSETDYRNVRIVVRDVAGNTLDQNVVSADVSGAFEYFAKSTFTYSAPTWGQIEVNLLDNQNNIVASETVDISLASGGAPTPTPIPILSGDKGEVAAVGAGVIYYPAGAYITTPDPGARVTFPIHIAGYLQTSQNGVDLEFRFEYTDQPGVLVARATQKTVLWGQINVFIISLDIDGRINAHPETDRPGVLTIWHGGSELARRYVTVVGRQRSKEVQVVFRDSVGNLASVPRRVPFYGGSNDALNELFWGPSTQEGGYITAIPNPDAVRAYLNEYDWNPLNAIVHVRSSHTSGGVVTLVLSHNIRAANSAQPDRAAEQICRTVFQFPNIKQVVMILEDDRSQWQSQNQACSTLPLPSTSAPLPPTAIPPGPVEVTITEPGEGVQVGVQFRVAGTATVPQVGDKIIVQLTIATPEPRSLFYEVTSVVGAAPGQVGTYAIDVSYEPPAQPVQGTLSVTYLNAANQPLKQAVRTITLTSATPPPAG